jgi:hypothetical protein
VPVILDDVRHFLRIPDAAEQVERRGDLVRLRTVVAGELDHHLRSGPAG